MDGLQVLVATMQQQDCSLAEKMNIRCSAVLANQADRSETVVLHGPFGTVKMITTATRGVGRNRNIALEAAEGEFLLFADDDVVYYDDMPEQVCTAFRENPRADILIFGIDILKGGQIVERRLLKKRRLYMWNAMRFGTVRIAIRRKALEQSNIRFHENFGGGCIYSTGEDSLFLKACFDRGLRVYAHDYVLGTCCKDSSTWFRGCDEKYFYDKGALMLHLFPKMPRVMAVYFGLRFKRKTEIPVVRRVKLMLDGVQGGKTMQTFDDYQ